MHQIRDILHNTIINGDIHKLKQVVRNIISNALKFTRGDGIVTINFYICCITE
jgi:signal transduction histidine kinase